MLFYNYFEKVTTFSLFEKFCKLSLQDSLEKETKRNLEKE
jgi:hypothetical protein